MPVIIGLFWMLLHVLFSAFKGLVERLTTKRHHAAEIRGRNRTPRIKPAPALTTTTSPHDDQQPAAVTLYLLNNDKCGVVQPPGTSEAKPPQNHGLQDRCCLHRHVIAPSIPFPPSHINFTCRILFVTKRHFRRCDPLRASILRTFSTN